MSTAEWHENLKPGDTVAVTRSGYRRGHDLRCFERFTKTQIILLDGSRFRRADLYEVGESSGYGGRRRLVEATSEIQATYRHEQLVDKVAAAMRSTEEIAKLSSETLEAVLALLP